MRIQFSIRVLGRIAVCILALVGGASLSRGLSEARADVDKSNPPQHFMSGDERAELVLRDMLAVLKRIDQRLERLERSAGVKEEAVNDGTVRRGRK